MHVSHKTCVNIKKKRYLINFSKKERYILFFNARGGLVLWFVCYEFHYHCFASPPPPLSQSYSHMIIPYTVLEFELRKAYETIKSLKSSLTEATGELLAEKMVHGECWVWLGRWCGECWVWLGGVESVGYGWGGGVESVGCGWGDGVWRVLGVVVESVGCGCGVLGMAGEVVWRVLGMAGEVVWRVLGVAGEVVCGEC